MKQFHRILLEKELVFFLKKTTNFCTATIFDIHLIKKEKKKSTEKPNTVHIMIANTGLDTEHGMSDQRMGKPPALFLSSASNL